jgi:hypothetical protein
MKIFVKVVSTLTLITIPFLMASCTTLGERETQPIGSPPVITASFASKDVSHGDTWRIYLEANDPDGDMWRFTYTFSSSGGGGGYRANNVLIREGNRARLLGYLSVSFSPPTNAVAEWTSGTLTLHIRDRGRNTSDKVAFPVALSRGVKQTSPPPPFDIGGLKSLGKIWVKLYVPQGD